MSDKMAQDKLVSRVDGKELIIERVFDAPRELLFSAFSDPVQLAKWWGPQGWETEVLEFDFKPKGSWLYCMKCIDQNQGDFFGMESCGKAVFQEIKTPEKMVYKDMFTDREGNVLPDMPEMLITNEFVEDGTSTRLISRTQFSSEETLKQVVEMGVLEGSASQYHRLDEYLKKLQR